LIQHTHYISAYLLDWFIELILSTGDKNIGIFLDEPLCGSKAYPAHIIEAIYFRTLVILGIETQAITEIAGLFVLLLS